MSRTSLIVDDEAHLRMLIQQALEELEDEGVELMTATNGEEALEAIQSVKPNLVFLDVMMPKLSGFEVCERLRADSRLAALRIVMLSARGREAEVTKGLALGADAYVTKPFSTRELLEKIRELLRGGQ